MSDDPDRIDELRQAMIDGLTIQDLRLAAILCEQERLRSEMRTQIAPMHELKDDLAALIAELRATVENDPALSGALAHGGDPGRLEGTGRQRCLGRLHLWRGPAEGGRRSQHDQGLRALREHFRRLSTK